MQSALSSRWFSKFSCTGGCTVVDSFVLTRELQPACVCMRGGGMPLRGWLRKPCLAFMLLQDRVHHHSVPVWGNMVRLGHHGCGFFVRGCVLCLFLSVSWCWHTNVPPARGSFAGCSAGSSAVVATSRRYCARCSAESSRGRGACCDTCMAWDCSCTPACGGLGAAKAG